MTITDDEKSAIEALIMTARHHANMRQVKSVAINWVVIDAPPTAAAIKETRPVVTVEFFP